MTEGVKAFEIESRNEVLEELILNAPSNEELSKYTWKEIRIAAHYQGVYGIPTKELIEFFSYFKQFGTCIEIASGKGILAKALDIVGTDNFQQTFPEVKLQYLLMQQPVIEYGDEVVKMDGITAVKHYNPSVVFSSWLTAPAGHLGQPLNMYGVVEEEVLDRCDYYVQLCGEVHNTKRIRLRKHIEVRANWIRGRSENDNYICIYCDDLDKLKSDMVKYIPLDFKVDIV